MLASNLVLLTHKPNGKLKTYKGLNMLHLIKTLMHLCRVPDLAWDPRKDILFLCQHYSTEIKTVQAQLDRKAIRQNFLGTSFITKLSPEGQRACYQTLLGQEPPPSMTVSPPPEEDNMYSRTGVKAPGLEIPVNTSRPVPVQRIVSELPGQSMGGRWGSYPSQPARSVSQPAELSATNIPSGPIELSASPIPSNKPAAPINPPQELAGSTVHSRSRYRHSSVPQSRKLSPPNSDATNRQRPTSADARNAPQQPTTFNQARYTNAMSSFPTQSQQFRGRPVEMSATPYNPGQPPMQTQLGLGGDYLDPRLRAANQRPLIDNRTPEIPLNANQGPQKRVVQQFGPTGIQSQTASQHATPADELLDHRLSPHLAEVTEKLRLVGPEGVYPPSPKRSPPAVPKKQPLPPTTDVGSTTIVAELEAHIDAALNSTPLQRTPTDLALYEPSPLTTTLAEPLPLQLSIQPKRTDSPVSPPEPYIAFSQVKLQETRVIQKPVLERTQTAPAVVVVAVAGGLPASLTAGSSSGRFSSSTTPPIPQQQFQQQPHLTRSSTQFFAPPPEFSTTASKYWNYSGQAQPPQQQQQQPQYTAYTTQAQEQPHGYPTPPHLSPAFPATGYKPYRPVLTSTSTSTSTSSIYPAPPQPAPAPAPATIATIQAPTPIDSPVSPPMALSFQNLRDVDGKGNYQRKSTVGGLVAGGEGVMVGGQGGGHGRNTSIDSVSSKGSQGSLRFAEEYQAELPGFGAGYAAQAQA